ncbi:hypothetical protein [Georgenia yuyongxinii]
MFETLPLKCTMVSYLLVRQVLYCRSSGEISPDMEAVVAGVTVVGATGASLADTAVTMALLRVNASATDAANLLVMRMPTLLSMLILLRHGGGGHDNVFPENGRGIADTKVCELALPLSRVGGDVRGRQPQPSRASR